MKNVLQNRRNSVTSDLIASNVVFVPAVFTLLESQEEEGGREGKGYNQYQQGRETVGATPEQSSSNSRKTLPAL